MVPFAFGKMSADHLKTLTTGNAEFKTYPGLGHSSSEQVCKIKQAVESSEIRTEDG